MKRLMLMVAGAVLVSLIYWLTRTEQTVPVAKNEMAETELVPSEPLMPSTVRPRSSPIVSGKTVTETVPPPSMPPGVTKPKLVPDPLVQVVKHSIEDFAWGEFHNTEVKTSLQIASAEEGAGTFISARYLGHQSFDTIKVSYEGAVPPGSALKLELRLMNSLEWSEWQELAPADLNREIQLNNPAAGWQYKLTFSAPLIEATPRVQSVTVVSSRKAMEIDDGVNGESIASGASVSLD